MSEERASVDVLVVGGGPAGSTAAALLAREGRSVLLLEKERFPRYHVGESLLAGVLPFLDELGAREAVEAHGFQRKLGQTFIWGPDRTPWQIDFAKLDKYPYAYFVERAELDQLLLRNAARHGARIAEEHAVSDFLFDGERVIGAVANGPGGRALRVSAGYTVDASGQSSLLARRWKSRRFLRGLRNLAVWSYWRGAARLPPPQDEHIVTVSIDDGWVWFIPLRDGVTSVGVVTMDWDRQKRARMGEGKADEWYVNTVHMAELVGGLLADAERIAPVRMQRDWSYRAQSFHGPGCLLAGDAACFIDPVLSTGVNLAMSSGYLAALTLNSALAEPANEAVFLRYYQQAYRALFDQQLASVKHFYRVEARRESVYWKSKALLKVDPRSDGELSFLFINSGLLRHATSLSPADTAGQARALFGGRLDGGASGAAKVDFEPRAERRWLLPEGELVAVSGADRRYYGVRQRGMRLALEPFVPIGMRDRPPGTAFLLEIEALPERAPVGTILVEEAGPHTPARVRTAGGFAVTSRVWAALRDSPHEQLLSAAATEVLERIGAAGEPAIAALEKRLRSSLRTPPGPWRIARRTRSAASLLDLALVAELSRPSDSACAWIVVRPRRPVELAESPFARTRLLDLEYRLGKNVDHDPIISGALRAAAKAIREGVAQEPGLEAAMTAAERVLSAWPSDGAWQLVGVRRRRVE